jgi:hypothetical protein
MVDWIEAEAGVGTWWGSLFYPFVPSTFLPRRVLAVVRLETSER